MSITSAGLMCDVCGNYCLTEVLTGESVQEFGVKGIERRLHCDKKCEAILRSIGTEWEKLPEGPLRKVFQESDDKLKATKERE